MEDPLRNLIDCNVIDRILLKLKDSGVRSQVECYVLCWILLKRQDPLRNLIDCNVMDRILLKLKDSDRFDAILKRKYCAESNKVLRVLLDSWRMLLTFVKWFLLLRCFLHIR